jgi:hypothetical protein
MASPEQRNPYKGTPARAWLRLQLLALDGSSAELELVADTGNPFAIIVPHSRLQQFKHLDLPTISSNFGLLQGGWLQVRIPALGFDQLLVGYGSDAVVAATQRSSADFEGLAGLPLLRLAEYGSDGNSFWIRSAGPP